MNKIQRTIKAAGTNKSVADKLGCNTVTVWYKAKSASFTREELIKICDMTDGLITVEQLVDGDK